MMNFIGEMAKAEQADLKNLQNQYMKGLIPQHLVNPLIEQVREMVNNMLDNLKD